MSGKRAGELSFVTTRGNVTIDQSESDPPLDKDVEAGETYTFEIQVSYQYIEDEPGTVEMYFPETVGLADTASITGSGEYETVTLTETETIPEDMGGNDFYITIIFRDDNDDFIAGDDDSYYVDPGDNTPPEIEDYKPEDEIVSVVEEETVDFWVSSSDDDGDSLTHTWYLNNVDADDGFQEVKSEDALTSSYSKDFAENGDYVVEVKVSDGSASDTQDWFIEVERVNKDHPPSISRINPTEEEISIDEDYTQEFEVEVSDPDEDLDTVEWFVNGTKEKTRNLGAGSPQQDELTRSFEKEGTYEIESIVTDSNKNTDSLSWTATVGAETHLLSVTTKGEGSIVVDPPGVETSDFTESYEEGTEVELTAAPEEGNEFSEWIGDIPDGSEEEEIIAVSMNHARDISAVLTDRIQEYDLSLTELRTVPEELQSGQEVEFEVKIINQTTAPTEEITALVKVGDTELRQTTPGLSSEESRTVTVGSWEASQGVYDVTAVVGPDEEIDEVSGGENTETLTLEVERTEGNLEVEVQNSRGESKSNAHVTLRSEDTGQEYTTHTNPGTVRFEELEQGYYSLVVDNEGFHDTLKQETYIHPGENRHLSLFEAADWVTGVVVTENSEEGVDNATVEIDELDLKTETDQFGYFEFDEDIPDAEYRFRVSTENETLAETRRQVDFDRMVRIQTNEVFDPDVDGGPEAVDEENTLVSVVMRHLLAEPEAASFQLFISYGAVKGSVTALLDFVEDIKSMLLDFDIREYIRGIKMMISFLFEEGVRELVALMREQVAKKQNEDNPYDSQIDPIKSSLFSTGWYSGYIITLIAVSWAAGKGTARAAAAARRADMFTDAMQDVRRIMEGIRQGSRESVASLSIIRTATRNQDLQLEEVLSPVAQGIARVDNKELFMNLQLYHIRLYKQMKGKVSDTLGPFSDPRGTAGNLVEGYFIVDQWLNERLYRMTKVKSADDNPIDWTRIPVGKEVTIGNFVFKINGESPEWDNVLVRKVRTDDGPKLEVREIAEITGGTSKNIGSDLNKVAENLKRMRDSSNTVSLPAGLSVEDFFRGSTLRVRGVAPSDHDTTPDPGSTRKVDVDDQNLGINIDAQIDAFDWTSSQLKEITGKLEDNVEVFRQIFEQEQ